MLPDNILFSDDPASDLGEFLSKSKYSRVVVLADENTYVHCYPVLQNALSATKTIKVKSGEEEKNIHTCLNIWQHMTDETLDRHACLVILGGGVLGDMGGFCASTYKRGINFVLIPTTLLAQADASIGGKLGIDFNNLKNHIGVFQQPTLTLLSSEFLKTLPEAELRSGFAEVIKHTLISDREMWKKVSSSSLKDQPWDLLIRHSVEFKAKVTTADPTERGLRKILNAGHTVGHALETHLLNSGNKVLHGEAIAAGLIAEAYIANQRGLLNDSDLQEITRYITSIYGKISIAPHAVDPICALMLQDKKNKGNKILCALLNSLGHAKWDYEINVDEIKNALAFYQSA